MDVLSVEFWISFWVAGFSSWYGSQVGGGGLVYLSYLLFMGVPPQVAIGTHRVVVFFGKLSSSTRYVQSQKVIWKYVPIFLVLSFVSSFVGGYLFINIPAEYFRWIMLVGLSIPLVIVLFNKKLGVENKEKSLHSKIKGGCVYFGLGIWSTIMSAGSGIMKLLSVVYFFGLSYVGGKATLNVSGLLASAYLVWFFWSHGFVDVTKVYPSIIGYMIGSYSGAYFAIRKGNVWVRKLIIVVTFASVVKVLMG